MRVLLALTLLAFMTPAQAADLPSSGIYTDDVTMGETNEHAYSTHGSQPCLGIYMEHTYFVTLVAEAGQVLLLEVAGQQVMATDGTARITFTANYCTAFQILVEGIDVDGDASYVLAVEHVVKGPTLA